MYTEIRKRGARVSIISSRSPGLRGKWLVSEYVNMDGVDVHRLYRNRQEMLLFPHKELKKALAIAKRLRPDVIFCSQESNVRLALLLQRQLKVPIVLRVEMARTLFTGQSRLPANRFLMPLLGMPFGGSRFWSWLCEKVDAVITHDPLDIPFRNSLSMHGKPVFYVPWPARLPEGIDRQKMKRNEGIYAGSLHPIKNIQVFERVIPKILEETSTEKFTIIGSGPLEKTIRRLERKFPRALEYYKQLPRIDVLELISSSCYGYTPTPFYSYGFTGDCWGLGTPLLLNHNICASKSMEVAIGRSDEEIIKMINRLHSDQDFYKKLETVGYDEFKKRSPEIVAEKVNDVFRQVR
jgi:glycosyltransferase involved in cell wall biosynthesis